MNIFIFILACISLIMILNNLWLPTWLRLAGLFVSRRKPQPSVIKKISVILPVYNEEKNILKRLVNIKEALAGIAHTHEVLIGSDGSQDQTVKLAEEFILQNRLVGWKALSFPNEGKGQTINKLVRESVGDLIVSTDCDVSMEPSALGLIVKVFEEDERIGCLSSVPTFGHENKNTQSFYWNIDMKIREAESRLGRLIVVTGWLYAFRKELFTPIPSTAMADDLWVPMTVLIKGFKCAHHAQLKAFSEKTDEETEVMRRGRVIAGGVDIIKRLFRDLLKRPGLLLIVFFHKINRWLLPLWCLVFVGCSLYFDPYFLFAYLILFIVVTVVITPQRMFYLIRSVISPALSFFHTARKKDLSKWEHTRL